MTRVFCKISRNEASDKGFTLIELLVALTVMGILLAIAMPSFIEWRNNANYRQAARQITSMLREARSFTITRNIPHSVVVDPVSGSYSLRRNAAVVQQSIVPPEVLLRGDASSVSVITVEFRSNGTASLNPADGLIFVQDGATPRFLVTVTPTGRISLQQR